MRTAASTRLRQRADYTHKHNLKTGRHGWLRLTPAYSVKIVEELIDECDRPMRIFDPFCGTATTALSAAYHGHYGVTTDINPFLVWLGQAKTAHYSSKQIASALNACMCVLELVKGKRPGYVSCPPIHNIERWWSSDALAFLCAVKGAMQDVTENGSPERTLLSIAFCRTLISLSNASFNHQSMSFKDDGQFRLNLDIDMPALYTQDVDFVLSGAAENPEGLGQVILGDSRNSARFVEGPFNRVITSPPYANRMSYIRELRPYMYWLGFLVNGRDAGELDWSAIGGTWGVATSRLTEWQSAPDCFKSKVLTGALERIAHQDNKNGVLLSNYIAKYFDDMWVHFRGLTPVLASGAEVHYIVGNSTFYGVLLPVEQLYAEMLRELGFTHVECKAIRKRNSKKELIEFDVTAIWP
jgi:hypothetical protein